MTKEPSKIGFVGTDGRMLLAALETSRATSELYPGNYQGIVVRGMPAMEPWSRLPNHQWPIDFIPTASNSAPDYATALIEAFENGKLDVALVGPEGLLFDGLVDIMESAGFGNRIIGLNSKGALLEGNKIYGKRLCQEAGVPVAPAWADVDARDFRTVSGVCQDYLHDHGGAVLKYPFSAGGKGARIILNTWQIREVYDGLMADYADGYKNMFGKNKSWPLLIEARMAGVEISFTVLVDRHAHYQILPTAMDYPERFPGSPGIENPITGGMGAISPHPWESPELLQLVDSTIIYPLTQAMWLKNILRPCVIYPGCFVTFWPNGKPRTIRVCEINIRPGEPEFQPVVKRLRNLGPLLEATVNGTLDRVQPEVREDQISLCIALVTGSGGPQQQKGYPWSCTKGELLAIDFDYFVKKKITVVPSAMDYVGGSFISDGTRVGYLIANATVKAGQTRGEVAEILRQRLLAAFDNGKIRVAPRGDVLGNRLDCRRDIGTHFQTAETLRVKA